MRYSAPGLVALLVALAAAGARPPAPAGGGAVRRQGASPSQTGSAAGRSAPGGLAIPSLALIPMRSAEGEVAAAAPPGWSINATGLGDIVSIAPAGRTHPAVFTLITAVSDLRYKANLFRCSRVFNPLGNTLAQCVMPSIRMQLADSSRPWTPEESLRALLALLQQSRWRGQSFGNPSVTSVPSPPGLKGAPTQALYRVSSTGPGGWFDNWGMITVFGMPNAMLGRGAVTSVALFAGCSAQAGQANRFARTCAGVIHSIRLAPDWAVRYAATLADTYAAEMQGLIKLGQIALAGAQARQQMIERTGRAVQQMQYDAFQRHQRAMLRSGESEIATLSGDTIVTDPETGKRYEVPYGYARYCLDDTGNYTLMGPDLARGTYLGHHICSRLMAPSD